MLDTIKLRSPTLTTAAANAVREGLISHRDIVIRTGELASERIDAKLPGPFGVTVHARLVNALELGGLQEAPLHPTEQGSPIGPAARRPALVVEASVPKLLLGHNIVGGPGAFGSACHWFVELVGRLLGVSLPDPGQWRVERVDWAEAFFLNASTIPGIMAGLKAAHFPHRKAEYYGLESVYFRGDTTLGLYHKGPAVEKHDLHRLRAHLPGEANALLALAGHILRCEVSLKRDRLVRDFEGKPRVGDVTADYLCRVYDDEVATLLQKSSTLPVVRRDMEVHQRLFAQSSPPAALKLYGLWHLLATFGELYTRNRIGPVTFYRERRKLRELGCSWLFTDLTIPSFSPPSGFCLTRESPYRDTMVSPQVMSEFLLRANDGLFRVSDDAACMYGEYLRHWSRRCRSTSPFPAHTA